MSEQHGADDIGPLAAKLDIGSVIGRSFSVARRNMAPLGVVTLIYVIFQAVTFQLYMKPIMDAAGNLDSGSEMPGAPDGAVLALYWLFTLVFNAFLIAIVTYGTVQDLRGRPASLGEWFRVGLSAALPTVVLTLVWYVIIGTGTILFVIPGIILMLMLWVVFPVMVMERPGIVGSLRRSAFLTQGNRWRLLGLLLLLGVVMGLLVGLVTFVVPFGGEGSILSSVVSAVLGIFWLVVLGVTYYDLRMAKEGVDIGRVAAVFD
jgi:hypothetical protein